MQLSVDIATCSSLSDAQRRRALHNLEHRLDGTVLTVSASTQRSQARNRAEARERMAALLREALAPPPPRGAGPSRRGARYDAVSKRKSGARNSSPRDGGPKFPSSNHPHTYPHADGPGSGNRYAETA